MPSSRLSSSFRLESWLAEGMQKKLEGESAKCGPPSRLGNGRLVQGVPWRFSWFFEIT